MLFATIQPFCPISLLFNQRNSLSPPLCCQLIKINFNTEVYAGHDKIPSKRKCNLQTTWIGKVTSFPSKKKKVCDIVYLMMWCSAQWFASVFRAPSPYSRRWWASVRIVSCSLARIATVNEFERASWIVPGWTRLNIWAVKAIYKI